MGHLNDIPEQQLIGMLAARDEAAFSYLYDKYAPCLYGLLLKETGDAGVATQVLRSVFLKAWEECTGLDCVKSHLLAWLMGLTQKTANVEFRLGLTFNNVFTEKSESHERAPVS